MARSKTIKAEAHYFEQFLKYFSLPSGVVSYGGSSDDKPDLTLKSTNSDEIIIGIEQTRFFIEDGSVISSEQIQARRRLEVIEIAERGYRSQHSEDLRLSICFNKNYPILSVFEVAENLLLFLSKYQKEFMKDKSLVRPLSIPEINSFYVQWDMGASWQLIQVYSGQLTSKERLQEILDAKSRQAEGYRRCGDLWLLVIIDFCDRGQDQEIDDKIEILESNHFSKVVLFKTIFNQIKEIPCIKKTITE